MNETTGSVEIHHGVDDEIALPPMTEEALERAQAVPRVKTMRRALRLTQEQFAEKFLIPLGTLRDWEQGQTEPDGAARAYLRAIRGDADGVARALHAIPPAPGTSEQDRL